MVCFTRFVIEKTQENRYEMRGIFYHSELLKCEQLAAQSTRSWRHSLKPHLLKAGEKNSKIMVKYLPAKADLRSYQKRLQDGKLLEWLAEYIQTTYKIYSDNL